MSLLLAHLLKWAYQVDLRGNTWRRTIKEQRRAIRARLERTPSLEAMLNEPMSLVRASAGIPGGDECSKD